MAKRPARAQPCDRGLLPTYATGVACPGCGGPHWSVGAITAECVRCTTALPLAAGARPATLMARSGSTWRPASYERGDVRTPSAGAPVIMERRGGHAWRRAGFAI